MMGDEQETPLNSSSSESDGEGEHTHDHDGYETVPITCNEPRPPPVYDPPGPAPVTALAMGTGVPHYQTFGKTRDQHASERIAQTVKVQNIRVPISRQEPPI